MRANKMNKIKQLAIFSLCLLFYATNAAASSHKSYFYVTIDNQSDNNYVYSNGTADGTINHQNAVSHYKTIDALVVTKTMIGFSGSAPKGDFSYENQTDHTVCSFKFDTSGVTPLNNNQHCLVTNYPYQTTRLGVAYRWDATITII